MSKYLMFKAVGMMNAKGSPHRRFTIVSQTVPQNVARPYFTTSPPLFSPRANNRAFHGQKSSRRPV